MGLNYEKYTDEELVQFLKENKETASGAFKVLYDRYSPIVHSYCVKLLGYGNEAEDIFQEIFIKFYKNVTNETGNFNISAYLMVIARNLCINSKRDKKASVSIEFIESDFATAQNYEDKELLNLISSSLDLLEDDYREAFVLKEYNGLTYQEISELLGITLSNAKARVIRARQKIKQILQPYLKELT